MRHNHKQKHSSLKDQNKIIKNFDDHLTHIGQYQAYLGGIKLLSEIDQDKQIIVLSSPHMRCLQTAEVFIRSRSVEKKLHQSKFFVEDILREQQEPQQVGSLENFYKLHFFEEKIIGFDIGYNELEYFSKFKKKEHFNFPELQQGSHIQRTQHFLDEIKKFALKNIDKIILIFTHGVLLEGLCELHNQLENYELNFHNLITLKYQEEKKDWQFDYNKNYFQQQHEKIITQKNQLIQKSKCL